MAIHKNQEVPVGAHFSIAKGYKNALIDAVSIGASAVQIFAKNPMAARFRKVNDSEKEDVKNFKDRDKIKYIVIHASYLLNFARPLAENSFPIKSLVEDLYNADALGADGVVLHLGKYLEMEKKSAEENFVKNIKVVLKKIKDLKTTPPGGARIILENTAGQGTEMGFKLENLGRIYKKIGNSARVKFCFDTAHAFGAGYDLSDKSGVEKAIKEIDKYLGIKNIACIHLNDSKKILGSRVDRHEDIGHGTIGYKGLKFFIATIIEKTKRPIPLILETPQNFDSYEKQIKKVKRWSK